MAAGPAVVCAQPLTALTDVQIQAAIDLGRTGEVPTVKLSSFLGDFDVLIEGPVSRIAASASTATRQYKPFSIRDVTPEMRAPHLLVSLQQRADSRFRGGVQNIVLELKGSTSIEAAIQPLKQQGLVAIFDRLPEGEFEVIVVLSGGRQRYAVSLKDRARLDDPLGARTASTPSPSLSADSRSLPTASGQPLRLAIQGDGQRHADAVRALEDELRAAGIVVVVVPRSESYDYMIILGEGRDAAAAIALDPQGNLIGQAVSHALTERGAVEGASRELGKKLAARAR